MSIPKQLFPSADRQRNLTLALNELNYAINFYESSLKQRRGAVPLENNSSV